MTRTLCPNCHQAEMRRPIIVQQGNEACAAWSCRECNATFVQELPELDFSRAVEEVEAQ